MLHAVAKEAEYSLDLGKFDEVYREAIDLRNRFAHGGVVPSSVQDELIVVPTRRQMDNKSLLDLSRNRLLAHVTRSEWLRSVAMHFCVEIGAVSLEVVVAEGESAPFDLPAPSGEPPPLNPPR